MKIADIYPQVDLQIQFPHPKNGLYYNMLSESQLIALANRALDRMLAMNIEQILVSETGAIPFAKLCAWLSRKKKYTLQWYSIKIPRNLIECFPVTLSAYLSLSKKDLIMPCEIRQAEPGFIFSEQYELRNLPADYFDLQNRNLNQVLNTLYEKNDFIVADDFQILASTAGITQILAAPFIFFDEYLDSGKTLFQTLRFLKLFAKNPQFKIFTYLIKLPAAQINQAVCDSVYTLDEEDQAYQLGVYPFENRMDWLGYFYSIRPDKYSRISLAELCDLSTNPLSEDCFLDFLASLNITILVSAVKSQCKIEPVAQFISQQHVIQYSLYQLEKELFGENNNSEFFYQLFDQYGPIWSPLPDAYHLTYLEAFNNANPGILRQLISPVITKKYTQLRSSLIGAIACLIESRRLQQQNSLFNLTRLGE